VLRARVIEVATDAYVAEGPSGEFRLAPGHETLEPGGAIALPTIEGPHLAGLPMDEHGFIPIDEHARVPGVADVYAAGDGTNFPIKQGGLATQQADAAIEHLASQLGAAIEAHPFHPVLRGKLLTGDLSLNLRHDVTGGHGEGNASLDYLWWPPQKIGGRYLAPWLGHTSPDEGLEPPTHSLDVEVSLPTEWHSQPIAIGTHPMPL
jgi:sulfide:quinone oxidoreductase